MLFYRYDPETYEYLHTVTPQPNPARSGEYLIPPSATSSQPPEPPEHQAVVFDRDANHWRLMPDHRGQTVYSKTDHSELKIETLGPLPVTHTDQKPGGQFCRWNESERQWDHCENSEREYNEQAERQWAMTELAISDRLLTPDFPATDTHKEKILEYRAQLRNPARSTHPDFPNPAWRPQWPQGVKRPAE